MTDDEAVEDSFLEQLKAACDDSDADLDFLSSLEPSEVVDRLAAAREAASGFELVMAGDHPLVERIIETFSIARASVIGDIFDRAWSAIRFSFDVSVWGGADFEPILLGNGAILIRNHHRVLGVSDTPSAIVRIRRGALKSDLDRLFGKLRGRASHDAFLIHRTEDGGMVRLRKPPRRMSEVGQTLAFIGYDMPIDICRAIPPATLRRVQEQSRSGHVLLRIFGDHVFFYPLYRFSDDLDILLEEYAEARFDEADAGEVYTVDIDPGSKAMLTRFGARTRELLGYSNFPFPDTDDVMRFHVEQKTFAPTWNSYAGRKVADASELTPFFAGRADRPADCTDAWSEGYPPFGNDRDKLWALSSRLRHDMFAIEIPAAAFSTRAGDLSDLRSATLKETFADLAPLARSVRVRRLDDDPPGRLQRPRDLARTKSLARAYCEARDRERQALEGEEDPLSPEEMELRLREALAGDAALRLIFVFQGLPRRGAVNFNALHHAMCGLSGRLRTALTWRFPRFGLVQSYADGDLDSGNHLLFVPPDEEEEAHDPSESEDESPSSEGADNDEESNAEGAGAEMEDEQHESLLYDAARDSRDDSPDLAETDSPREDAATGAESPNRELDDPV